jgi:hypothetical protein
MTILDLNINTILRRAAYAVVLCLCITGKLFAQVPAFPDHNSAQMLRSLSSLNSTREKKQKTHKYRFKIIYKNDSTGRVTAELNNYTSTFSLLIENKDDMYLLFPKDTKEIRTKNLIGIATDNCWLFKVSTGRINRYSVYPDKDAFTYAVQKGDQGKILLFNQENMAELVADSQKALKLVREGKLDKALLYYNY